MSVAGAPLEATELGKALNPSQPTNYRRAYQRMGATGRGTLTWDAGHGSRQCSVQVRNISDGGAQLLVSRPLAPGWTAYLTGEMFECIGAIQYCVEAAGGFLVGLSFERDPYAKPASDVKV